MTSTCRLCLCEPKTVHSLLKKRNFDMLDALTSIKVLPDDLSTVACTKCLDELTQAYNIQQKIIETNEKFLEKCEVIIIVNDEVNDHEYEVKDTVPLVYKPCPVCALCEEESALKEHIKTHFECPQYCDVCQSTFSDLKQYREHWNRLHTNEGVYKCTICDLQFRYKCIYWMHMDKAHDTEVPHELDDAKVAFEESKNDDVEVQEQESSSLVQEPETSSVHVEENTKEEIISTQTRTVKCTICNKQFTSRIKLKSHVLIHKPKKSCTICKMEVSSSNYAAHMINHKQDPRVCEICGSVLRNASSLRAHINIIHTNFRKACEICGQVFTHVYRYQLHMKKHKGEKSYICESCGKSFYTRFDLKTHTKSVHLKLRPYNCSFCQKAFSSSFAKKTHERQHTMETPYCCDVCGEAFRQNISLKSHLKSKHNIVEEKTCECTICGKAFGSEHALISHSTKQHNS